MAEDWRKIDRGLFESPDGQWRISNPWRLETELRHRWFVGQRRDDGKGWHMLDVDHATLQDARAYVAGLDDGVVAASGSAREHGRR
jgi:uncharacterized protein YqjF (DUF2071 family)